MTLPKRLEKEMHNGADSYEQECKDNWHSPGLYLKADYKKGFNQCANLLLPELEKMREALKLIAATQCDYKVFESETNERLIECIIADTDCARDALASLEEFLNGT